MNIYAEKRVPSIAKTLADSIHALSCEEGYVTVDCYCFIYNNRITYINKHD